MAVPAASNKWSRTWSREVNTIIGLHWVKSILCLWPLMKRMRTTISITFSLNNTIFPNNSNSNTSNSLCRVLTIIRLKCFHSFPFSRTSPLEEYLNNGNNKQLGWTLRSVGWLWLTIWYQQRARHSVSSIEMWCIISTRLSICTQ